jgi:hypothetical protein
MDYLIFMVNAAQRLELLAGARLTLRLLLVMFVARLCALQYFKEQS